MNIKEKSIITLDDDKKYVVIKQIENKNVKYYFALNVDDSSDFVIFYVDGDEIVEIQDEENVEDLIVLFNINSFN